VPLNGSQSIELNELNDFLFVPCLNSPEWISKGQAITPRLENI
jgi:hypothetical protein